MNRNSHMLLMMASRMHSDKRATWCLTMDWISSKSTKTETRNFFVGKGIKKALLVVCRWHSKLGQKREEANVCLWRRLERVGNVLLAFIGNVASVLLVKFHLANNYDAFISVDFWQLTDRRMKSKAIIVQVVMSTLFLATDKLLRLHG
jgi:hypothetical protein